jgi:signal transduction histidine kinase
VRTKLLGRPSHETIHYLRPDGSPFPAAQCPLLRPRLTGETLHLEHDWFVRKDGTQVAVSYSSAPVDLAGGRGAVVAFRDISDRLRLGEVQASRARIAKAADDARRTIERDLHDGAPAAIRRRRDATGNRPAPDRHRAGRRGAAGRCRARRPPRGNRRTPAPSPRNPSGRAAQARLTAALRTLARRSATPVDVTADDVGRLDPEIEATAYYIAAEATTNAVKHASAGHVEIALARTSDALQLTVTDDGSGGAAFGGGTGLQGLRDRADAAGGRLTLVSPAGGPTVLTADLPIPGPPAAER